VKSSRHVWTEFCGPTGDGKWCHQILSSEILQNVQVFEDLQMLLASSSGFLSVCWPHDPWIDSWFDEFSEISISSIRFDEEILEIRKK